MIIDAILDRKMDEMDGNNEFNAQNFVKYVEEEAEIFGFKKLEKAAKDNDESEMKAALCEYIDAGGYPANLKEYVAGKYWTLDSDDAEKIEKTAAEIAAGVEKIIPDVMKDISDIVDESTKTTNEAVENILAKAAALVDAADAIDYTTNTDKKVAALLEDITNINNDIYMIIENN